MDRFDDRLLLFDGAGEGFLAIDVLFVSSGFGGEQGVPGIRHREHHAINVFARHYLAVIMIGFAVLVLVMPVNGVDRALEMFLIEIACGYNLAIGQPEKVGGVARPLHSPTDYSHGDAIRWRRLAKNIRRDNDRRGKGQPSHSEKTAAADSRTESFMFHRLVQ